MLQYSICQKGNIVPAKHDIAAGVTLMAFYCRMGFFACMRSSQAEQERWTGCGTCGTWNWTDNSRGHWYSFTAAKGSGRDPRLDLLVFIC